MNEKDLNGKSIAKKITSALKEDVEKFREKSKIIPRLAMVAVGDDPSAAAYMRSKQKACMKVGMESEVFQLPAAASLSTLLETLESLNCDRNFHGIILEYPLPAHISFNEAVEGIDPCKDVDGLHPYNMGLLFSGRPAFVANTPKAVIRILDEYGIDLKGKNVTIVGRGLSVGKPLFALMLARHATVTCCHTRTSDLASHTRRGEILVAAAGKANLITGEMVSQGAVVIDVGINITDDGSIVGDVNYEEVYPKASYITPVPGGIGPLTVSMILENTLKAAKNQTCLCCCHK